MGYKKITSKEAEKLLKRLGLGYGGDGTTFYAAADDETDVYEFDTKKERDDFVSKHNSKAREDNTMTKQETMEVLEKHFNDCLRYWERELKVDSDLSNEAYIHAISEIATTDPRKPCGEKLNPEWVAEFRKYRLMDCYGNEWEKHI